MSNPGDKIFLNFDSALIILTGNHMLWLAALRALADEDMKTFQIFLSLNLTAEVKFLKYAMILLLSFNLCSVHGVV
jgi:hypothetical protein